ncbi:hypothetical protein RJ640_024091 [Escallonia rubra]|uniref:C2 NT-type domain-containing protein n=1 Tax=Escallonia rubra TaxID=112253 RepID=A0AA88RCN7_9ASTE|nr:hypothetical protein RJ640_024091 [Escallonia rubra]
MFRLQRQHKSSESGEKVDFKFSNFQAIQVPKGWDKLFVSLISVGTGKTVAKSTKAPVRNGNCQWSETLSESLWISKDDSSKELEGCLFKLVVSMGSARSGILGEATVNMAGYMSSTTFAPLSLPLKKCNYGTVLQVKIHCLTPRMKLRDEETKSSNGHAEDQDADSHSMGSKSNGSGGSIARSLRSPSSQDFGSTSHPGKFGSKETSYSPAGSNHSFNSANGSVGRGNFSTRHVDGDSYNVGERQDASSSRDGSPHGDYSAEDASVLIHSSFSSRDTNSGDGMENYKQDFGQSSSAAIVKSSLANAGSSKNLLEAAEDTIEELRDEAKMWERNARQQMLDLDILRRKYSDQSKKLADLEMELSAACTERDGIKKEVEQLKLLLKETMTKQAEIEDSTFESEGITRIRKELEDEIKFQKESNASLAQQLAKNQESNIELVSILQEMEETIEKQKVDIENLSTLQLKFSNLEDSILGYLDENRNLVTQLQQLQESENTLQVKVQMLEQALKEKNDLETEQNLSMQSLLDSEREYKCKLSVKEEELVSLEAKLMESVIERHLEERKLNDENSLELKREIEALKEQVKELERDCTELTNENLELLCKLKNNGRFESEVKELQYQIPYLEETLKKVTEEFQLDTVETSRIFSESLKQLEMAFHQIMKPQNNILSEVSDKCQYYLDDLGKLDSTGTTASKVWARAIPNYIIELNKLLEARITEFEEVFKCAELENKERSNTVEEAQKQLEDYILKVSELSSSKVKLEANLTVLEMDVADKGSVIANLQADLLSKEEEVDFLRRCQLELEVQVANSTKENNQLQETMEIALRESNITSKCLDGLQHDLLVLKSSVDSHVSANKILERKSNELECANRELELHLFKMEEENIQLSERVSGLEAQLRYLTDEKESSRLELENAKCVSTSLQDEIRRLVIDMERQKVDFKQKSLDLENQRSEAQEERDFLKIENQKLQESTVTLTEESNVLQKTNGELKKQKLELHERCRHLESELNVSQKSLTDCSKRIEALEGNIFSVLSEVASKEKTLTVELDALVLENRKQKEKHFMEESLLKQMYLENTTEVENLQREVEHLTKQISATHDERERIASEAVHEVSSLRVDRAKLESAVQEAQSRAKLVEEEIKMVREESEMKVQGLMVELVASKQSHEPLMADHEKMLKLLANYRTSEDKLKTAVSDLELKLTVSEYEHQQLIEETVKLKAQLLKISHLQDDFLAFKRKLSESKFEKEKLEASLNSLSRDYEELKAEKMSCVEKISSLQKKNSEFEDCKRKVIALEDKLLRREGDLTAKEALCAQDAELRNELSQIKRANKQYQLKVKQLEDEKDECLKKAQALKEDLRMMEGVKQEGTKSGSKKVDNEHGQPRGSPRVSGVDHVAKLQLLENELAQALEAKNKYKGQLERWV